MKKPLDLKKATVIRPTGPRNRGRFVLKDGDKTVGHANHSTINDKSIQGSAQRIVNQARNMGRKIRLRGGMIVDPSDEDDDDGELSELIRWWSKK